MPAQQMLTPLKQSANTTLANQAAEPPAQQKAQAVRAAPKAAMTRQQVTVYDKGQTHSLPRTTCFCFCDETPSASVIAICYIELHPQGHLLFASFQQSAAAPGSQLI